MLDTLLKAILGEDTEASVTYIAQSEHNKPKEETLSISSVMESQLKLFQSQT